MTKTQKTIGQDGNLAEEEGTEESGSSEETSEETKEEEKPQTPEEVKKSKEAEEERAKLRKEIEEEYVAKLATEKADKDLQERDSKEKVSDDAKNLADTLKARLGEHYPPSFNNIKIYARITAMIGLQDQIDKLVKKPATVKGESSIPKPVNKEVPHAGSVFTKSNSFSERAKEFPWMKRYKRK